MVRPRSEEKQTALLDAAANVVAAQGLGARTAAIAQCAGVAEGTLFRYFATKDAILNESYLYLKRTLAETMRKQFAMNASLKDQVRSLWDGYMDWGIAHPSYVNALKQLAVSEIITEDTRAKAGQFFPEVHAVSRACIAQSSLAGYPGAFADAVFMALADSTIQFAIQYPKQAEAYKAAGFKVFWKGLTE